MSIPPRRTGDLWLAAAGVKGIELSDRLAFDSYILAQEAAIEGRGLAMTIGPFATDEIKSGRLVQPFPLMVPHRHHWQFACAAEHASSRRSGVSRIGCSSRSPPIPTLAALSVTACGK